MAGSVNKAILIGHLGADPEVRYTPNGDPVATFNMATSENRRDKEGNQQEQTEWHRIVTFGKLAEICGQYLKKGKLVYIEGRIQTRNWEDKEGVKRYTTEIVASNMTMLGKRGEDESSGGGAPPQERQERNTGGKNLEDDDDLPF